MCKAEQNAYCAQRRVAYLIAGAALVAGGILILSRLDQPREEEDPLSEAQRMISRAQSKISEIEAGLHSTRPS
jgi:hypothetical protein